MRQFWTSILAIGLLSSSCGGDGCIRLEGPRETVVRYLEPINSINLVTPLNLTLETDTNFQQSKFEVRAQAEVHPSLKTNISNGQVNIFLDGCFKDQLEVMADAEIKELKTVRLQSAGEISSSNLIEQDSISIFNSGLGDIDLALKSHQIDARVESSGDIILTGDTKYLVVRTEGSGEITAFSLYADSVVINNFGSSVIQVHAGSYLEVNFFSETTVEYRGEPEIKTLGTGNLVDSNF